MTEEEYCYNLTVSLYEAIADVVHAEMLLSATISFRICEEIIVHYRRDIERLYAVHHKELHPTKHCSYLAFWIRKLKPVSNAYPMRITNAIPKGSQPPIEEEDTCINEEVSLMCAFRFLYEYVADGDIVFPKRRKSRDHVGIYIKVVAKYLKSIDETDDMSMGNRYRTLVYDMRYRTFGPHHLTHVLTHVLREVVAYEPSK